MFAIFTRSFTHPLSDKRTNCLTKIKYTIILAETTNLKTPRPGESRRRGGRKGEGLESLERQIEVSMEQSAARESSKGFVTVTVLVLVETFSTIEPRMNHRGRRIPHGSFNMLRGTFRGSDSSRKSSQTRNSTGGKDFYTFLFFLSLSLFSFFFSLEKRDDSPPSPHLPPPFTSSFLFALFHFPFSLIDNN